MIRKGIFMILLATTSTYGMAQESNENKSTALTDSQVAAANNKAEMLELVAVFNDAIDAPTEYNEYVKPYLQLEGFPSKIGKSKSEYDNMLVNWINSNSATIKQFYLDRQKAHDELYGPRKKD